MKCGVALQTNNEADVARFVAVESGDESLAAADGVDNELFEEELRMGDLIEPLGFDSIWGLEHHFTPYVQQPDPLQWLAFWAGRTERLDVGTMLLIMPWHDPVRVAEQLVVLQHMLGDREMSIGIGRGLGIREYAGLRVPMGESRGRFAEGVRVVQTAVSQERFTFDGEFFQVPDRAQREGSVSIRPRPRDARRLLDSLYGGWMSPPSVAMVAELGLRPIVIPNKDFDAYVPDLERFASLRAQAGLPPANPIVTNLWCYCAESDAEVEDVSRHVEQQFAVNRTNSAEVTYEMARSYHANVPGYEFYERFFAEFVKAQEADPSAQPPLLEDIKTFVGTPDRFIGMVTRFREMLRAEQFVFGFRRWNVPYDLCEKSMRLFAKEVLPYIHELSVPEPLEVPALSPA